MTVTVEIPDRVAKVLAPQGGDLARAVLEAVALEGYRRDLLTEAALRRLLGFDTRLEVHEFLKQHGVYLNYGIEEAKHDVAEARYYAELKQNLRLTSLRAE